MSIKQVAQCTLISLIFASSESLANRQVNLTKDVIPTSHTTYNLHMTIFWICVMIGVVVFSILMYALIFYRKPGKKISANFHALLGTWMIIPLIILVLLAIPVMTVLAKMCDESKSSQATHIISAQPVVVTSHTTSKQTKATAPATQVSLADSMKRGEQVYMSMCATCHKPDGTGSPPVFPALKGSPITTGPVDKNIDRVINGRPGTAMQAFKNQYSDEELAAVITYERNAFGNNTGTVVQPSDIAAARQKH